MAYIKKRQEDKLKTGPKPLGVKKHQIYIKQDDLAKLKEMAKKGKVSTSHLVRMVITDHLKKENASI